MNKTIVMGRLTRDPELRYTQAAQLPVARFSLAVNRRFSKEKEVDYFDVVAWRHNAELVSKYFTKGQLVCVEGRLQQRKWTDKDGNNRYAVEIIAESSYFAGSKPNAASAPNDFDPFYDTDVPAAAQASKPKAA